MENYRPTRRSLFVRRRMSLLVRFQTDQDDLWRRSGALHSKRQLRKSETQRTCHRGYGAEPRGSDDDGIVRKLEFFLRLHRRESDSGTTQSLGSDRCEDINAGRIEENRNALRADRPQDRGQRSRGHPWAVWYVSRSPGRRRPGWRSENCESAWGRSASSRICAGAHFKDDLQRRRPKMVLGQLELYVRDFHGR